MVIEEPKEKYAVAFFDGQNLFHHAREAFGFTHPNYDPLKLANAVAAASGCKLTQARFYTGVPPADRDAHWHKFWMKKILAMTRQKVHVTSRPLRYRPEVLADGSTVYLPTEKGIDVRIAIDIMTLAWGKNYDVAIVFSQDQDLSELALSMREVSKKQGRWIKIISAFPDAKGQRGINGTDWFRIDEKLYTSCVDPNDYR